VNKGELIEAIAKETELSKAAAGRALEAVISTIVKTVSKSRMFS
jgi:nucleoid DNA-binding protein